MVDKAASFDPSEMTHRWPLILTTSCTFSAIVAGIPPDERVPHRSTATSCATKGDRHSGGVNFCCCWLVGWVAGWLAGWLVGWWLVFVCLFVWLGWLAGWLLGW